MVDLKKFPTEYKNLKYEIEGYAREYGLDFFDTIFEVLDFDEMNELAAYGGFPARYPHWRFGMEYERLSKSYSYGLHKIYEMVINNDPCYAYLLASNSVVDQKLVMAHVYGHCDFFKNNLWFSKTNRKMMDQMGNHATRIRRYVDKFGDEAVSNFIDTCLSLEELVDIHGIFIKRGVDHKQFFLEDRDEETREIPKFKSKDYMDIYINPKDFVEKQKERLKEEREKEVKKEVEKILLENPEKDALNFLINYAALENWQKDVLAIIREEAYYFAPQKQTKILNEGWASYWHAKIMTEKAMNDSELIIYADHHSGTMGQRPGRINPYKLGLELLLDIEDRWNKGRHGREWEDCEEMEKKKSWDTMEGKGREKIFEIRRSYNDIEFIDEFLTPEFCREQELFSYAYSKETDAYAIDSREFEMIKKKLLFSLTNFGKPIMSLTEANFGNRGELILHHDYSGIPLKMDYAQDTLKNLFKLWKRPVHLETVQEDKDILISCIDGNIKVEKR